MEERMGPAPRAAPARVDEAFAAIDQQMPRKAVPKWQETKQWLLWADVRGSGVDRWNASSASGVAQVSEASLHGQQLNALMGLTYRTAPNLLVGMLGGYENFSYAEDDINGRLRGDGWTVGSRNFSSGRASAGGKLTYPVPWLDGVLLAPYVGVYAAYYFTQDDAAAIVAAGGVPLASTPLLQGWSARVTGGVGAKLAGGAMLGVGGELGGIGGNTMIWTLSARTRVPFAAQ